MSSVLVGHGLVKQYGSTTALAMLAAIGGSRPLLRKVTADPAQTAG